MGSPCWGMPQQGLSAPAQSKFPDLTVQYLFAAAWTSLKTISFAVFCESAPLVRTVR
jgi:hypothetical protein